MGGGKKSSQRRGRPSLPAHEVKRHAFGFRTTKELKEKLLAASEASGRSIAQEIEARLLQSIDRETVISEVIDAVLGGKRYAPIFMMMAASVTMIERSTGKSWLEDHETFMAVKTAWDLIAPPPSRDALK